MRRTYPLEHQGNPAKLTTHFRNAVKVCGLLLEGKRHVIVPRIKRHKRKIFEFPKAVGWYNGQRIWSWTLLANIQVASSLSRNSINHGWNAARVIIQREAGVSKKPSGLNKNKSNKRNHWTKRGDIGLKKGVFDIRKKTTARTYAGMVQGCSRISPPPLRHKERTRKGMMISTHNTGVGPHFYCFGERIKRKIQKDKSRAAFLLPSRKKDQRTKFISGAAQRFKKQSKSTNKGL